MASTSIILTSFLFTDPHNAYLIRAYLRESLIFVTAHVSTVSLLQCSPQISALSFPNLFAKEPKG